MDKPFVDIELKCRECGKISKINELCEDEYLPLLDGYFCQCDTEKERPLAGHNIACNTYKFYLKFAEVIG